MDMEDMEAQGLTEIGNVSLGKLGQAHLAMEVQLGQREVRWRAVR